MSIAIAAERVPLSFLLTQNRDEDPPVEPVLPFTAWRQEAGGQWWPITVTALMERTAAFHALNDRYDTSVLRFDLVHVEPGEVKWQTKRIEKKAQGKRWNGPAIKAPNTHQVSREIARKRSDERALADQARQQREEQLERERLAARRGTQSAEPVTTGALAEKAEGEPMPVAKESTKAKAKVCRVCGEAKSWDQFPSTGRNAGRCYSCAALAAPPSKAAAKSKKQRERAKAKTVAIPAESKPVVLLELGRDGAQLHDGDALVSAIKNLIAERNALRAQLDAIEAALVHV